AALARGREVIVSRGQQVEIGGAFRMPDVMRLSGARMVEVGTTNRTRVADYEEAIGPRTAALLRVHTSNYRVTGFTESTPPGEVAGGDGRGRLAAGGAPAGRPGQRRAGRGARRAEGRRVGAPRRRGDVLRRQAAGRTAGGHRPGPGRADRPHGEASAGPGGSS